MSESQKITISLDKKVLAKVVQQASLKSELRTKWISDAINARLNEHNFGTGVYAKAVSAALYASQGKLNRVDAECVAAKIITVIHQG
jgi:metal-responsive CopG/Arc/MetJ family transcriptional regulator|tara:strand:+ start:585 stop:845 length:261 start_codon:yes stop_codon:yes gene_type:complete